MELSAILSDEEDDNERKIEICAIAEDNIAGYNYITIEAFLVKDTNFALAIKIKKASKLNLDANFFKHMRDILLKLLQIQAKYLSGIAIHLKDFHCYTTST